jgi:S-DNA-T family DNA segregation ATPase FtsK/SpoIIIE
VLIDTKGLEFGAYAAIERHFLAKLPGEDSAVGRSAVGSLATLEAVALEVDRRYEMMQSARVKNITAYNASFVARQLDPKSGHQYLTDLVVVIDDLGSYTYEGASHIFPVLTKIVTEGYKAGIYCVFATSQTSSQTLPGNLLSLVAQRVVFRLNSKEDYRRFFDTTRFDIPYGQGHFLFNEGPSVHKGQSILFDLEDIENITGHIALQRGFPFTYLLPEYIDPDQKDFSLLDRDPLLEEAARLIVQNQVGSTSLIQRRMKLGYNRAGRLMDQLEAVGVVGVSQGSKPREVLIQTEAELDRLLEDLKKDH